jgi:allantoin racemase
MKMRIRIIAPAIEMPKASTDRELEYLRKHLPANTELETDTIDYGYKSVETEAQAIFNGTEIILKAKKAQDDGVDGIFINCFDDPAVFALREMLTIPVLGAWLPSVLTACSLGERVGIITTESPIYEERKVKAHGFEDKVVIDSVNLGVLELGQKDLLLDRLQAASLRLIKNHRVHAIIFGCTGMNYIADELRETLKAEGYQVPVVEPLLAGVAFLENMIRLGFNNNLGQMISLSDLKWHK